MLLRNSYRKKRAEHSKITKNWAGIS